MKIIPTAIPVPSTLLNKASIQNITNEKTSSFNNILGQTLKNLNDEQLEANDTVEKFLTGEIQDIHTVMIALEEARLSMQLAVEVRNKLVEAYQEISRMQV